jgi:uncharacterized membrane protein YbhN (UPF0104 family)
MVAGALECVATAVVLVGAEKAAAGGTSLVTVALVGIALATVVALVGGGPGVVDVAVISALVAVGSTFAPAVGAVILARGITFWTPVVLARPLVSQLSRRLVL